MSDIVG